MANEITNYVNTAVNSLSRFNLNNIQTPISFSNETDLLNLQNPLSFIDWLQYHTAINSGNEYKEYNIYLRKWYANKANTEAKQIDTLRNDYAAFLQELSLVFKDDPQFKYISEIDFDDNLSIEYAIPYFTKKIKEICFYIISKRESAKLAKLKYNMAGSNQALEKLFYQYLLQAFTNKNTLIQVPEFSGVSLLPDLSAVGGSLKIHVEELNDNSSYFDKDPTAVSYLNVPLSAYFEQYGLEMDSYDWIFNSGTMPLCSDNPFFWTLQQTLDEYGVTDIALLPFSAVDLSNQLAPSANQNNLALLSKKYAGNDFYVLTGGYYVLNTKDFNLPLAVKNNWFYWPSGEHVVETYNTQIYDALPINDTSLVESGATYSSDYRLADKIFVEKEESIRGAWLRYYLKQTETRTMSCALAENQTVEFKFPYCDYGIIGDGTEWTGRGISNLDTLYGTLDDDSKKAVDKQYWAYVSDTTQICAISINDTTLVDDGAHASSYYLSADKVTKRTATNANKINDTVPNGVYVDGFEYAWLYGFSKTDLPVKVGKSMIQWPIQRVDDVEEPLLNVGPDVCAPIALSSISISEFLGSRAGYQLNDSDILYKLNGKGGYPIECAYLKGYPISESLPVSTIVTGYSDKTYISTVTGVMQVGLTHKCKPDTPETFIWQDETIQLNYVGLNYKPHQDDCPFVLFSEHPSVYEQKDALEFEFKYPWKECECKSILYSPIGHPGDEYDDYGGMADIIFLDTQDPQPFDITTWRGSDNLDYKHSRDFAWFKLEKTETNNAQGLDVDVGAGRGRWVNGAGTEFVFAKGKQYKYIRTGMRRSYDELLIEAVPPMIISRLYRNNSKPSWKKAILNTNGDWVETTQNTDMVLNAGDYLHYDHYQSDFYCLKYNGTFKQYTVWSRVATSTNVQNDFWVNNTFATTGMAIKYQWPSTVYNGYSSAPRTDIFSSELSAVRWTVRMGATSYTTNMSPEEQLTVISYIPATIYTSVTGFVINGQPEIVQMTPVVIAGPVLTSSTRTSGTHFVQTIYADTINFMLNVPLSGWNYATSKYDGKSSGIKPFWGQAVDDDSRVTKNKGVREWGYGLRVADDYTLIHQPKVSFLSLQSDTPIKYEKKTDSIIWRQPVDFIVNDETKEWCDLIVVTDKTSPLSSYLRNQTKELVVYPTSSRSTFVLENGDFINYWANSEFTWVQTVTDSRDGIPPFGGTYVPYASSLLIRADVPYANLSNRHYPSIAVYPNATNLYTDRDSGGYMSYKGLGALTYVAKEHYNAINPALTANELDSREVFFRDPSVFVSNDEGLSNKVQNGPIRNISNNSSWMKGRITEGARAGRIVGESDYKEFSPYQTKEETIGKNTIGLISTDYNLDPWYSEFDDKWKDTINWPPNFRQQYPVKSWYAAFDLFLKRERNVTRNRTITLEAPYFCPDGESRNLISKTFINTSALGAAAQLVKTSFTDAYVTSSQSMVVSSDGGITLQVNSDHYKSEFLPVYYNADTTLLSGGSDNLLYGERKWDYHAVSYGMLEIQVNGSNYFTPLYRSSRTACEVTNLSGNHVKLGTYTSYGYMMVYLNESEKRLLSLYKKV